MEKTFARWVCPPPTEEGPAGPLRTSCPPIGRAAPRDRPRQKRPQWWPCSAPRRPAGVAVVFSIASAARLLRAGRARVAFSASLVSTEQWSHQGPFAGPERLVFRKVTTNIGDAYDPGTGEPCGGGASVHVLDSSKSPECRSLCKNNKNKVKVQIQLLHCGASRKAQVLKCTEVKSKYDDVIQKSFR